MSGVHTSPRQKGRRMLFSRPGGIRIARPTDQARTRTPPGNFSGVSVHICAIWRFYLSAEALLVGSMSCPKLLGGARQQWFRFAPGSHRRAEEDRDRGRVFQEYARFPQFLFGLYNRMAFPIFHVYNRKIFFVAASHACLGPGICGTVCFFFSGVQEKNLS